MKNKIIFQDNKIVKFLVESKKYGNKEVIIDAEDLGKVSQYNWRLLVLDNGFIYIRSRYYVKKKEVTILLHRLVMDEFNTDKQVDHIFGNTLDNRKSNLRICSSAENLRNQRMRINCNNGYKGITWDKRDRKWMAQIMVNYKRIHLGRFENKIDAAKAYNKAALKYHGEYARLNEL